MILSGNGISSQNIKILKGFQPDTKLALSWQQLSSGNYACTDRGTTSDLYQCDISFYGTEIFINNIINLFESNREAATLSNQITLSTFNSTEHIFGSDLDYSGNINCNVMSIQQRNQGSWRGFSLSMRLAVNTPTFLSGNGYLPPLQILDIGYNGDAEYTVDHQSAYKKNTYFNPDHAADTGIFTGTFTFTDYEMSQIRTYIRKQRGNTISLPQIYGVQYPFGRKSSSYPYSVKIIDFKDMGMNSVLRWQAQITFAEQLS